MKNSIKRAVSLLTVLILLIGSIPVSIMAKTGESSNGSGITIDLSKTGESLDEILNNISGLNALANGEETKKPEVHSEEESNEEYIEDIYVEISPPAENEVDDKLDSATLTESPATDFEYIIYNNEVTITGYIGSATEVVIPAEIEGYPVTSIGVDAFFGCSSLASVTIPGSVTSIGNYAFYDCSSLTSITIPDGVTSIGIYAFCGCSSLTSITIPDGVMSIGDSAFFGCSSLTSITIPDGVTSIRDSAFYGCSSLTSITIPGSVTSIGNSAFCGCSSLTSITIPDGVMSIGYEAFRGCSSLTSITIPNGVMSIGNSAFCDCSSLTSIIVLDNNINYSSVGGVLFNKNKTELIRCPEGKKGSYTIPDGVTSIGDSAFFGCSSLTYITIPESVTEIGNYAFDGCRSLTSITIPDSVTSIGNYAFDGCRSLTSITIPDSVTSIGNYAFFRCSSLTSIIVLDNNTNYSSVGGVLFNKNKTKLICCPVGKKGSYTTPGSVTSIGNYAFYGCSSLTSITLPNSITSIGNHAFDGCSSLTSITIPDSVTSIGNYAFDGCRSLTSITIPDSVTSIGNHAFYGCSSLTSITIPASVTSIGDWAFSEYSSLEDVYYTGTEEEWNNINISHYGNGPLLNATIHFDYVPSAPPEEVIPSVDSDIVIDTEKNTAKGIAIQTTVADVIAQFEGAENIQIVDKNGIVLAADALVGTGSKIQLVENGEVIDEVTVVIKGEIDGNGIIDSDDAIYMLRNTLFPDTAPVVEEDDVDGNGIYDSDDAIYLLRYTLFPDMFPLK